MKIDEKTLKTSSGKVLHFGSARKLKNWERIAEAYKHGWRPGTKK